MMLLSIQNVHEQVCFRDVAILATPDSNKSGKIGANYDCFLVLFVEKAMIRFPVALIQSLICMKAAWRQLSPREHHENIVRHSILNQRLKFLNEHGVDMFPTNKVISKNHFIMSVNSIKTECCISYIAGEWNPNYLFFQFTYLFFIYIYIFCIFYFILYYSDRSTRFVQLKNLRDEKVIDGGKEHAEHAVRLQRSLAIASLYPLAEPTTHSTASKGKAFSAKRRVISVQRETAFGCCINRKSPCCKYSSIFEASKAREREAIKGHKAELVIPVIASSRGFWPLWEGYAQ